MIFLSSNHYSHDDQVRDVVNSLSDYQAGQFVATFPEWPNLVWNGAWLDAEASGVDVEYTSWVTDWLENNTQVSWWEGEPVIWEDGDDEED